MKLLKELAKDPDAIASIYFEITSIFPDIQVLERNDCLILNAAPGSIIIYYNGKFNLPFRFDNNINYFKLIKLILSLGYDVTTEQNKSWNY